MDCRTAVKLINLFVDGELSDDKALALNEHIVICRECAAEMAAFRRAIDAMNEWRDLEPAFTLADIKARAANRQPWRRRIASLLPRIEMPAWSTAVGVTVGICLGVVGGASLEEAHRQARAPGLTMDIVLAGFEDPITDALQLHVQASSSSHTNSEQEVKL